MNYEIGLYNHNARAYEAVKESFKETDKTCIVHATGTGKSFIALQLIYDFIKEKPDRKIVYLTPLNGIKTQVQEHIEKIEQYNKERGVEFHKEYFENVEFITYSSAGGKAKDIENLNTMSRGELSHVEADLLIVDEFHHIGKGAENWKAGVDLIIDSNPNIKVFGMSATSVRNKGTSKEEDVASTFFEGNVASEYPIEHAITDGTLPAPNYHAALTFLEDECAELEEKVKNGQASIEEKKEYEKILRDIRYRISSIGEKSVQDIINQYLKADGKYIYFCPGGVDIIELQNNFLEMLPIEIRENVEFYQVHSSKYSSKSNEQMAYNFYYNINSNGESAKGKLRVMFAIDMYNEGIHVPDIDGVIMGRNTSSDIIFYQQLGRALSVKKKDDNDQSKIEPPLVIDLQDNFRKILKLYNKVNKEKGTKENNDKTVDTNKNNIGNISLFYNFGISDKIIDIVLELDKVRGFANNNNIGFKASLKLVYNFLEKTGKLPSKYSKTEDEKKLGRWINNNIDALQSLANRQDYKKYKFSEYEEEYVEMARAIENKRKENDPELKFKTSLKSVYNFFEKTGKLPSTTAKTEDEKKLGQWLSTNRTELLLLASGQDSKIHPFSEYEEEYVEMARAIENKRKENEPELKFKTSLKLVYNFLEKTGKLPSTKAKTEDEKKLGIWLKANRTEFPLLASKQDSGKHPFSEYEEEYVEMARAIENKRKENEPEFKFKTSLKSVYNFLEKTGKLPGEKSKTEDEKKLGNWLHKNITELPLLASKKDSGKHPFSEYEEEYVEMAKTIENKRKENEPELKFKTSLKSVYDILEKTGKLPSQHAETEDEQKLGNWLHKNRTELLLLASKKDSEKHPFSEYKEEYVEMAKAINKRKENASELKFQASLKSVYTFLEETGKLPSTIAETEDEKKLSRWLNTNRTELPLLASGQDSGKHPFSEYEEKYVEMAKAIENKRKENDPERKFQASLKSVYTFLEETGKLPSTMAKTKDEKKLGRWLSKIRTELLLLASKQDSGKHPFSEYEEEYVEMAKAIAIVRGWISLEEAKTEVPNEQVFRTASSAIINGTPKINKGEEYGRTI